MIAGNCPKHSEGHGLPILIERVNGVVDKLARLGGYLHVQDIIYFIEPPPLVASYIYIYFCMMLLVELDLD